MQPGKEKANLYTCTKHGSYEGPSDCLVSLVDCGWRPWWLVGTIGSGPKVDGL